GFVCDRNTKECRRASRISEFPAKSQKGHLSVPKRRAVAFGIVRLQTAAEQTQWRATARACARRPAADRHDLAAGLDSAGRIDFSVQTTRSIRRLAQRIAPAHRHR